MQDNACEPVGRWTIKELSARNPRLAREETSGRNFLFVSLVSPVAGRGLAFPSEDLVIVQIFVRDNNVDQALKALKKKMQREGSFREMKRHVHYEKPSEKRARQKAEAVRRARKLARKRAQREIGRASCRERV